MNMEEFFKCLPDIVQVALIGTKDVTVSVAVGSVKAVDYCIPQVAKSAVTYTATGIYDYTPSWATAPFRWTAKGVVGTANVTGEGVKVCWNATPEVVKTPITYVVTEFPRELWNLCFYNEVNPPADAVPNKFQGWSRLGGLTAISFGLTPYVTKFFFGF